LAFAILLLLATGWVRCWLDQEMGVEVFNSNFFSTPLTEATSTNSEAFRPKLDGQESFG
jgi:hypothetical protein